MSVSNGQSVNAAITNAAFLSRLTDSDTVAKVGLKNTSDVNSGAIITNAQRAINKAFEGIGATGEADTTINDYASNNYVTNGDNRKEAIEALDLQLGLAQTQLDNLDAVNSTDVSLAAVGSTPNANGASLTGQVLNLQPADGSSPGVVSTTTQTFAGNKTFSGNVTVSGNMTVNGTTTTVNSTNLDVTDKNITVNDNGNDASSEGAGITVERTTTNGSIIYKAASASKWAAGNIGSEIDLVDVSSTQAITNKSIDGASNSITNVTATGVSGIIAIANGGTGQSTATTAFNALSPSTTKGDLITNNGTDDIRLAVGSDTQVLVADSAQAAGIKWTTISTSSDYNSILAVQNLGISATVASNALTISVKQADGTTDPSTGAASVKAGMRSSSLTAGAFNLRSATASLSLVISSGSTLGHKNGGTYPIYIYLIDNAGTVEVGASTTLFDDSGLASTTAEGGAGAADLNSVLYTTTARTSAPFKVVGKLVSTQTTAGTWATTPSQIILGSYAHFKSTDRVHVRHSSTAAASIAYGTPTWLDFSTVIQDTNATVAGAGSGTSTSSGNTFRVTANKTMYVTARASVEFAVGASVQYNGYLEFYLNGSLISRGSRLDATSTSIGNGSVYSIEVVDSFLFVSGSILEVVVTQTNGSVVAKNLTAVAAANFFTLIEH